MKLFLVRAEDSDGNDMDRHVLAASSADAVELWKAESDCSADEIRAWFPRGFVVHRVVHFDLTEVMDCPGPRALDWDAGEHFPA